jgi:hypothetical protein
VQRVPSSAIAHVSVSPPLIPDGRISRVRLAVSDLHALSPHSLPTGTEASVHAHLHPSSPGFALRRARDAVDQRFQARSPALVSSFRAITVPRAPWPLQGVTPQSVPWPMTEIDSTRSSSLLWAHAPDHNPLAASVYRLGPRVLAGCCVPLLGVGLSRRYLLNLSMGAWTRTPPRSSGALARFFPDDIGLTSV